jgi:hypothetical protein
MTVQILTPGYVVTCVDGNLVPVPSGIPTGPLEANVTYQRATSIVRIE